MRLDHIAYRVKDRNKTSQFFQEAFKYVIQEEFDITFPDGTTAKCIALEPPEKPTEPNRFFQYVHHLHHPDLDSIQYHLAPEIFVSDGSENSIVGSWVAARSNIGGIHHLAYEVDSVAEKMQEWRDKGYAEFTTDEPLSCDDLVQVFTRPSELTGVIYEFIERKGSRGFCKGNVKELMLSTKEMGNQEAQTDI